VSVANVTSAGNMVAALSRRELFGSACLDDFTSSSATAVLLAPRGELRVIDTHDSAWTTCTWSADSATFMRVKTPSSPALMQPVARNNFQVQTGCGWTTSGFLPEYLDPNVTEVQWGLTDALEHYGLWYQGVLMGDNVVISPGTSGSCSSAQTLGNYTIGSVEGVDSFVLIDD